MEERGKRRKWTNNLMTLNEKGWIRYQGKLFMAADYIRSKIKDYLDNPDKLKLFLDKVKLSKIFVSEESDRDNIIALLENHGMKPTTNKFIILGK